jgi:hypothetical protein
MSTLPMDYGPRTTETLIEAIFNPVPTTSKKESPFTYYVPHEPKKKSRLGVVDPILIDSKKEANFSISDMNNGEGASVYSTESSGVETEHTTTSSGVSTRSGHSHRRNGRHEVDKRSWWKKMSMGSRPPTPVSPS